MVFSSRSLLARIKNGNPPLWFVLCVPALLNVIFGFYPVVLKMFASGSGEKANGFILTFYRDTGAVPVLFFFSYLIEGELKMPDKGSLLKFATLGVFGMFIGQMTYVNGAYLVGPDITSAMQPLIAVWTPIVSMLLCVEKVPSPSKLHTYLKFFGILAAVGGAAKLILSGSSTESAPTMEVSRQRQFFGCFSLLTDTISGVSLWELCSFAVSLRGPSKGPAGETKGIYFTLQKKLIYNQPNCIWRNYPIAVTGYSYLFGAVYMGIAVSYYLFSGQAEQFLLPSHALPALVYAIVFVSAAAYFMMTWTNKYIPASLMAAFWPVQVVATVTSAYLVFGDELTAEVGPALAHRQYGSCGISPAERLALTVRFLATGNSQQYIGAFLIFTGLAFVLYSNYLANQHSSQDDIGTSGTAVFKESSC